MLMAQKGLRQFGGRILTIIFRALNQRVTIIGWRTQTAADTGYIKIPFIRLKRVQGHQGSGFCMVFSPEGDLMSGYVELQVTTNFSFLRGASHVEELMEAASEVGLEAIAVTDRNTLRGIVRAHHAAKSAGVRLIVGARLDFKDFPSLLCFPMDHSAYGRLARMLTLGKQRAPKGQC